MSKSEKDWGAGEVLEKLRAGKFKGGAYAILEEVRNNTGFSGPVRSADALVFSTWPSRGIWMAGVEIKVSRGDWLRELKDPSKAEAIQQYCDYWWIAAPPGIVKPGELPENWGLIETSSRCKTVKDAPRLSPKHLEMTFLASVFRSMAEEQRGLVERTRLAARAEFQEQLGELLSLKKQVLRLEGKPASLQLTVDSQERKLELYRQMTGVQPYDVTSYRAEAAQAAYQLAGRLNNSTLEGLVALGALAANLKSKVDELKAPADENEKSER